MRKVLCCVSPLGREIVKSVNGFTFHKAASDETRQLPNPLPRHFTSEIIIITTDDDVGQSLPVYLCLFPPCCIAFSKCGSSILEGVFSHWNLDLYSPIPVPYSEGNVICPSPSSPSPPPKFDLLPTFHDHHPYIYPFGLPRRDPPVYLCRSTVRLRLLLGGSVTQRFDTLRFLRCPTGSSGSVDRIRRVSTPDWGGGRELGSGVRCTIMRHRHLPYLSLRKRTDITPYDGSLSRREQRTTVRG